MEVGKIFELATKLKTVESGMKSAMELMKEIEKSIVKPPQTPRPGLTVPRGHEPLETPTAPPVDAKRLDRIWKYLQAFIPKDAYAELHIWAVKTFDYKYYGGTGKYPIDLRTAVCDKLSTFTESQIAELEKILEAKE